MPVGFALASPPSSCDAPAPNAPPLAFMRVPPLRAAVSRAARSALHSAGWRADWRSYARGGGTKLSLAMAAVLPMEPGRKASGSRGPWFEGWFLRLVDHDALSSIHVIFGSLRRRRRPPGAVVAGPFDEHLIVVGYSDGRDGTERTHRVLLDGPSVRLAGGAAAPTADALAGAAGSTSLSRIASLSSRNCAIILT